MEFEENSIPRAARLFFNAAGKGWPIDKDRLGSVLNRLVIKHNALRFGNAVAWSLSMMIHLDIPIAAEAILKSNRNGRRRGSYRTCTCEIKGLGKGVQD